MNHRLLVPRQSGFNPRSISGLAGWWDAADASTVTISTGASEWRDKSSTGAHAVQAVGNSQPAYQSSVFNGKNALYFDGANDVLVAPANAAFNVTALTLMAVFRRDNATGNSGIIAKAGISTATNGWGMYSRAGTTLWFQGDDAESQFCTASGITYTNLTVAVARGASGSQSLRANGTEGTPGSVVTSFALNNSVRFGDRRSGAEHFIGHICEVLFWGRVLESAEELLARNYLKTKWGAAAA